MENGQKPSIVCVDDEESLRTTLSFALEKEGYRVDAYSDGHEAWEILQDALPDMAIIDIMMPKMDGLELCRRLRGLSGTLPIIFLTSKDDEIDRIVGLELGADDYLCKPFSMRELLTRIKVIFRRIDAYRELSAETDTEEPVRSGPLMMDKDRFTVSWRGSGIVLTITEFRILAALAEEPGRVWNREQLLSAAYPDDLFVSDRAVDSHIKRIRKKMQAVDTGFGCIESIYGLGYKFTAPAD